ncbi:AAA domain [Trypanosoma vivax]|uniref:Origin recognition complex subunit 1 n=1 Tax=Trypanosoma vivax (strain Y486) TaxID=1055687 RepID=G0UBT3_TRYVY|nr:putative origin recognition complex subunit 1 (ORC1) [Trypanosoma vivax]KAH8609520.1 AAA domain [Trypanosoma vivax]CCC53281.1 putative origin recognition complex subunit 1 (ORC1) [Trypanosoma vivax Y486]
MKRKRDFNRGLVGAIRAGVEALSVSSSLATRELTCRDSHVKQIIDFLSDNVHPVMQIYGMPGTGKTASVNHALSLLADSAPQGKKPTAVFLNGYVIQKSSDIYWTLYTHLSKARLSSVENCPPDQCASHIEKRFKGGWGSSSAPLCMIVIDEVDKILKKHHKAFFRIVDWLSFPHAFCKLVTISNSMELCADAKTRSRLDNTRQLVFEPYNSSELKAIILKRISHIKPTLFEDKAIDFLCYQIASHYGDVRRLLQSASAALCGLVMRIEDGEEVAEKRDGLLTVGDVHTVVHQIFHDRFVEFIKTIQLPILFISVAVIAAETARILNKNSDDSRLLVDNLFVATRITQQKFNQAIKESNVVDLSYGAYLEIIETLRLVALIDVSMGEERIPIKSAQCLLEATENVYVSMLQPFQTVVDACELHNFGKHVKHLFRF